MKSIAPAFLLRRRRLANAILFLVIVLTAFSFRTFHYNTSVQMLNTLIREVPANEQVSYSFWQRFLPVRHNNFSPFTIESAMMFAYAQDIAEGKGVPARDETLKHMEDIPPYAQMNMALEWFLGWGWRLKNWIAPDPEGSPREKLFQDHPYMQQWMSAQIRLWASLTSGLIFLWLLLLHCPRKLAFWGAFLHAVSLAAIARSTGQDLVRGEFCIPLIVCTFVLAAWCSARPRWWKLLLVFPTAFLAFAAWDLCQMIFSAWALVEILRWVCGFRMKRGLLYAWTAIAAAVLLNAMVVPFNITYGLIHAPLVWVAIPSVFCTYAVQYGLDRGFFAKFGPCRRRWLVRLAVPVLVLVLYGAWTQFGNTPEYASNYSHFSEAMKAKLQFHNVKPQNALLLNFDARIMWTPSMHSANWEIASSFFPSLIFGRTLEFELFHFLFGLLPVTLAFYAVLLLGLTLFRVPRSEFSRMLSVSFLPHVFTLGFIVGFIYIVRYHEFVILFLCLSLPLLLNDYLRALRYAPAKVDPREAYTSIYAQRRLLKFMRGVLIGLFSFALFWETLMSAGTPRRYTGDVAMRETAMMIMWFRANRKALEGKGVAANFTVGPMLRAYAGTGLVMNPQFGMKRIRDATEEYLNAMFHGTELDLARYCAKYDVQYVIYNKGAIFSYSIYSNRYIAGANEIKLDSIVNLMITEPEKLNWFYRIDVPRGLEDINRVYSVFKVISSADKTESIRLCALGRSELALGNKPYAAELAQKAVSLDPTADGPRFLFLETHDRLPVITLSGAQ